MIPPEDLRYGLDVTGLDPIALGDALKAVINEAASDPARTLSWTMALAMSQQTAGLNLMRRLTSEFGGTSATKPVDKRFSDPGWTSNPFLQGMAETYLDQSRAAMTLIESSQLPETTRRKAAFAMRMLTDALSPSNVPWINPAVAREAMETGGVSLVRGMNAYLDDVQHNGGMPRQVDANAFTLGVDIAATPGRIVFRNELIELIAYEPQTAAVHAIPLLCSPPWINKYYVMDLAPNRSFVEWAVRHGHATFAISYRNPDAALRDFGIDDYLRLGLIAAMDAVERITGKPQVNIAALCLGGTLTLILLAYLAARGESARVASATVTNTLIDFSDPGDLGVFTDEATIERLEARMNERGFLDANEMARTFDLLRSNDLIWSYVVNNWFLGKAPPAFDILAWNADATRMPATMHSQYLRSCYLRNLIAQPNQFSVAGVPIDLGSIRTPLYVLAAESDHIAPWRSAYRTINHVSSDDARFTLTNAGHIAGIVNPPGNPKAVHWTSDRVDRAQSADAWRAAAEQRPGTWWEDWAVWVAARSGALVNPPGNAKAVHWTSDRVDRAQSADAWRAAAEQRAGTWWEDWAVWVAARSGALETPPDLPPGVAAPGHYVRNEDGPPLAAVSVRPSPAPKNGKPRAAAGSRPTKPKTKR